MRKILSTLFFVYATGSSSSAFAQDDTNVISRLQETRESISEDERKQREALSVLFVINKRIRETARKQERLNEKLLVQEGNIQTLAQDIGVQEKHAEQQKQMLNKRLRTLYQDQGQQSFRWLFSAKSPIEMERNHRFLKRMIDSDHRRLKLYVVTLKELREKRDHLKKMVHQILVLRKQARAQERNLQAQLREKSKYLAEIQSATHLKLSELKELRTMQSDANISANYAFFERKGILRPPVEGPLVFEYGTYVDRKYRFRLTHKGLFYSLPRATEVRAVYQGRVVFANAMPGFGKAVIIGHGDDYYSVYAFVTQLKVQEGQRVEEGTTMALSSSVGSPLFGPGLYFEIRHFTDAIDPRPWIKDSLIKTAKK